MNHEYMLMTKRHIFVIQLMTYNLELELESLHSTAPKYTKNINTHARAQYSSFNSFAFDNLRRGFLKLFFNEGNCLEDWYSCIFLAIYINLRYTVHIWWRNAD